MKQKHREISRHLLQTVLAIAALSFFTIYPAFQLSDTANNAAAATYKKAPKFSGQVKVPQKAGQTKVEAYYSVKKLRNNIYHIQDYSKSPGGKNGKNPASMYLIKGSQRALLIDGGNNVVKARKELVKIVNTLRGTTPLEIAVSHAHEDHVGQLAAFQTNTIYFPAKDKVKKTHDGLEAPPKQRDNYVWVKEGDKIDLGNYQFEVIETPGHTPGSVCYVDKKDGLIATGDSIGSSFIWLFDKKSLKIENSSLKHLYANVKGIKDPLFMPGHMWQGDPANKKRAPKYTPANDPMTMQYLKDMLTLTDKISNGKAKSHKYYVDGHYRGKAYVYGKAQVCMITH